MGVKKMATETQTQLINKKLVFSAYRDKFYHYASKYKEVKIEVVIADSLIQKLNIYISEHSDYADGYSEKKLEAKIVREERVYYKYTHKFARTQKQHYGDINISYDVTGSDGSLALFNLDEKYVEKLAAKWNTNKITEEDAKKFIAALADYFFDGRVAEYVKDSLTEDYRRVEVKVEDLGGQ